MSPVDAITKQRLQHKRRSSGRIKRIEVVFSFDKGDGVVYNELMEEAARTGRNQSDIIRLALADRYDKYFTPFQDKDSDTVYVTESGRKGKSAGAVSGYVYVVQCMGRYKIGCTVDIKQRMSSFQFPEPPHLVLLISSEDMYHLEGSLHRKFMRQRIYGEWFALSQRDIDFIKTV